MMRFSVPFIAAVALAMVGCGDKSKSAGSQKGEAKAPAAKPKADTTAKSGGAAEAPSARPEVPTLLAAGSMMPALSVKAHDGSTVSNDTLKGKPAVIYFYPKDFTPG